MVDTKWERNIRPWLLAKNKKPLWQQIREYRQLSRLYRERPRQYFNCMLYLKGHLGEVEDYMPISYVNHYRKQISPKEAIPTAGDKMLFYRMARDAGLSVIPVLAHTDGQGGITDADGAPLTLDQLDALRLAEDGKVFCKPVHGMQGVGLSLATSRAELAEIIALPEEMMVQPVLKQHPDLNAFNDTSANCVRIDTLITEDGVIENLALIKLGRKGKIADNSQHGTVLVPVDKTTGMLGAMGRQRTFIGTDQLDRHPDSGVIFAGHLVPHWDKLLAEVRRAALAFQPLSSIGWDVAITPDGPVIIEGNFNWSTTMSQSVCGGLRQTEMGRRAMAFYTTRETTD